MNRFLTAALVLLGGAANLPAQSASDLDDDDKPGRGVARISLINGDVSVKRGDSGDMTAAAINAPLVAADHLYTGAGSRAELQFDSSSFVRLASNGELGVAELEQNRYTVQLARGLVTLRVLRERRADIEVSTPSIAIRPLREGIYRIEVRDDGTTEVTVRAGEAEILSPQGSEKLRRGRTLLVRGATASPEFKEENDIPEDDWDRWNERRDKDLLRSNSYQYVSRDIYGVEDLDAHGRWVNVPEYGNVWTPYVAAGWAPYRQGRWAWIDWYGWSWVSYDPWGWAPYHYGRWFNQPGYGWCWWPGARTSRHWWRPALVGFFGWGNYGGFRAGVGFGFGNVGWIPLAPYERFRPWYGNRYYGGYRNNTYVDNSVRIVNNVNVTNVYRNARVRNGVSGLDAGDFVGGRGNRVRAVGDADLRSAASIEGRVPIVPDRQSLRLADRDVAPRGNNGRGETRFFGRSASNGNETTRASFDDQRRGMEQVARRTFGGGDSNNSGVAGAGRGSGNIDGGIRDTGDGGRRSSVSNADAAPSAGRRGGEDGNNGGWRSLGDTGRRGSVANADAAPSAGRRGGEDGNNGGWRSLGDTGRRGAVANADAAPSAGRRSGEDSNNGGWRSLGDTGRRGSVANADAAPSAGRRGGEDTNSGGGWRTFGDSGRRGSDDGSTTPSSGRRGGEDNSNGGWRGVGDSGRRGGDATAAPSGARRGSEDNSGGWRTFGGGDSSSGRRSGGDLNPTPSNDGNGGGRSRSDRSADNNAWRSFGDPGSGSGSSRSNAIEAPAQRSGWGGFGNPGSSRSADTGDGGRGGWRRSESDSSSRSSGGSESGRGWGGDRGSRSSSDVQISPPIVRQRSGGGDEGGRGWGGGGRSSGSSESTRPSWGGSGGGGRSYGGGDMGGGRSSGGEGGRSAGGEGGGGRSSGGGGGGGGRSGGGGGGRNR